MPRIVADTKQVTTKYLKKEGRKEERKEGKEIGGRRGGRWERGKKEVRKKKENLEGRGKGGMLVLGNLNSSEVSVSFNQRTALAKNLWKTTFCR